jgi:hypothetical protein
MPSELVKASRKAARILLLLLPALLVQCVTEKDRRDGICHVLQRCTGYVNEALDCSGHLEDAVEDGRISPSELARCARCVDENDTPTPEAAAGAAAAAEVGANSCEALLLNRDCDNACARVGLVLGAKTTLHMRRQACLAVEEACHVAACTDAFPVESGDIDAQETTDGVVAACVSCIAEVPEATPNATGGSGGTGGVQAAPGGSSNGGSAGVSGSGGVAGGETVVAKFNAERCDQMVQRCGDVCLGVTALDRRLTLAQAALKFCRVPEQCPDGDAAGGAGSMPAGGSSNTSGSGGAGMCAVHPGQDGCFDEFLHCGAYDTDSKHVDAAKPRTCLDCLEAKGCTEDCSSECPPQVKP